MTCPAAIAEARRMLQPKHQRGHAEYLIAPITASATFKKINWWCLDTIREAFDTLVKQGEAETIQIPGGDEIGYYQAGGRGRK